MTDVPEGAAILLDFIATVETASGLLVPKREGPSEAIAASRFHT